MSFRLRLTVLTSLAVAVAIVGASSVVYFTDQGELIGQIDSSLREKLTPGGPQQVQIRSNFSAPNLAKPESEGKVPPRASPRTGSSAATHTFAAEQASSGGQESVHGGKELPPESGGEGLPAERVPNKGEKTVARDGSAVKGRSRSRSGSANAAGEASLVLPGEQLGAATGYVQLVERDGTILRSGEGVGAALAVTAATRAVAAGRRGAFFNDETVSGTRLRVLTERAYELNGAYQVALPLADVESALDHLRLVLAIVSLGGIAVAALLGALVSRAAVAPLRRLTETTERIVETGDLSERIGHHGGDEISRLSARLDELLGTLEASLRTQRQLVADASHELRTPIATLRANFELLAAPGALDANERAELAADVRDELESMTTLVGELVELARGEEHDLAPREFRLDEVVQSAVERAARRAPDLSFRTRLEPSVITGVPERVERAVSNLLDNARKWSPASESVDVAVHDGLVEVRDRGPGIAAEDLPLVFNRFYRSATARAMPGAGLGLAIVKQIADAHGGSVTAEEAPGGGAILRLKLSSTR